MRIPFVVGRSTAWTTELVMVPEPDFPPDPDRGDEGPATSRPLPSPPFPGPWVLRGWIDVRSEEDLAAP